MIKGKNKIARKSVEKVTEQATQGHSKEAILKLEKEVAQLRDDITKLVGEKSNLPARVVNNLANSSEVTKELIQSLKTDLQNIIFPAQQAFYSPYLAEMLADVVLKPFEKKTPEDKIQKREDGYDYVAGSYMDSEFKQISPLYEYVEGWTKIHLDCLFVEAFCRLRNRMTGNTEIGTGGARIQVSKEAKKSYEAGGYRISPFDIVDLDKNIKSAMEQARKNAQRQFGVAADVYRRLEEEVTEEMKERWKRLIMLIPFQHRDDLQKKWKKLGAGHDAWMDAIVRYFKIKEDSQGIVIEKEESPVKEKKGSPEKKGKKEKAEEVSYEEADEKEVDL